MRARGDAGVGGTREGICFVFHRMDPGGAELRTWDVVRSLEGRTFTFCTLSPEKGQLDAEITAGGHEVVRLRPGLQGYVDAYRLFRRRRFATVHSQVGIASGPVIAAARLAGVPQRIVHMRSDGLGGVPTRARTIALSLSRVLIARTATHILGVAPSTLENMWSRRWRSDPRCAVLPNFVRVEVLDELAPSRDTGEVRVVNIGRAEPSKRRSLAVAVWGAFAASVPSALELVGSLERADEEAVERARRDLGKGGGASRVLVRGFVPDAGREMGRADLLLVTSEREGLPGVVLEALAAGTPVVSSDVPGSVWIGEQVRGVELVGVHEPVEAWVAAMHRALANDRSQIRASFLQSVFVEEKVVQRYRELWELA